MRRLPIAAAAAAGLLGLGDWAAWRVLTARLQYEYAAWTRVAWSHGWIVTADQMETGGFPFAATLNLRRFVARGGRAAVPGGVLWAADRVSLRVGLDNPWRLEIQPQGRELAQISGMPPIAFTADRIGAAVPLGRLPPGELREIAFSAEAAEGGIAGSRNPADVRLKSVALHLTTGKDAAGRLAATLRADMRGIQLPDTMRWPLGGVIASATVEAALDSPRLPGGTPRQAALLWRQGGGALAIHQLGLAWGPLTLAGSARLTLNEALQPEGEGQVRVQGVDAAIDALAGAGALRPGVAATAKAVLSVMAPAPNGPGLELPVALYRSTVAVAGIPLVELRPVVWPGT